MKLGLIGFGRLGQLLARYLSQDFDLLICDLKAQDDQVKTLGAKPVSLEYLCKTAPLILPLVPISAFDSLMQTIAPWVRPNALIVDACSVKVKPVESMLKHLPESVSILASHPMFGPDSASDTLFGAKLVLCPVRISEPRYQDIVLYLEKHGIKVVESTPEAHDQEISRSLFLTHMIGRTLLEVNAQDLNMDTKGYRRLMKILLTVQNDSWQLFEDMYNYNPYAQSTKDEFMQAMQNVVGKISC